MKYENFANIQISKFALDLRKYTDLGEMIESKYDSLKEAVKTAVNNGVNLIALPAANDPDGMNQIIEMIPKEKLFNCHFYMEIDITTRTFSDNIESFFEQLIEKLEISKIDFLSFKAVDSINFNDRILAYHMLEKIQRFVESGYIKKVGFSYADDDNDFFPVIASAFDWDFCNLEINYVDAGRVATVDMVRIANERGIKVFASNPTKDGKLLKLPPNVLKLLVQDFTPLEWSLNYIWSREGISSMLFDTIYPGEVEDVVKYLDKYVPTKNANYISCYRQMCQTYYANPIIDCTKCYYCMPCPHGINIPKVFEVYNSSVYLGISASHERYVQLEVNAEVCRNCNQCMGNCSRHLDIPREMKHIEDFYRV